MSIEFYLGVDTFLVQNNPNATEIINKDPNNIYINFWRGGYSKPIIESVTSSMPNLYIYDHLTITSETDSGVEEVVEVDTKNPTLLSVYNSNYLHFLYETIGRVLYLRYLGLDFYTKILVQGYLDNLIFSKSNWEEFGILQDDILYTTQFKELSLSKSINTSSKSLIHLESYSITSKLLRESLRLSGSPIKDIYVSRKNAISDKRFIKDEELIEKYFIGLGYEIVYNEELTFDQQRNIYKDARTIVGISGTGLVNILFAPDECKLIELRTSDFRNDDVFKYICKFLDNDYELVECFDSNNSAAPVINKLTSLQ
jgi:capsular polysaccharide biosynthesis protein